MEDLNLDKIDNVITPPTIPNVGIPIQNLDPIQAEEIKLDHHGHLLKSFWIFRQYTRGVILAYNHWITNVLPQQIMSRPIKIQRVDGLSIFYVTKVVVSPHGVKRGNEMVPFYPKDALDKQVTYSFTLQVEVERRNVDQQGNETTVEKSDLIDIGQIPAMVGSTVCNLYLQRKLNPMDLLRLRECPSNPLGYFIINGTERVLLLEEHLRTNYVLIFMSSKSNLPICRMTCNTHGGTKIVTIYHLNGYLHLSLNFMGRFKKENRMQANTVSVFGAFALMGVTDTNQILEYILMWTSTKRRLEFYNFLQTDMAMHSVTPVEMLVTGLASHIQESGLKTREYDQQYSFIYKKMHEELFPHIEENNTDSKLRMLGFMSARMLEYKMGYRGLDDRDSWDIKRIESAGKTLEQHFRRVWSSLPKKIYTDIRQQPRVTIRDVFGDRVRTIITQGFSNAFTKNSWGSPERKGGDTISDVMKRETSPLAPISQLNRLAAPTNAQDKKLELRMVQSSQYRIIGVAETPERKKCGLVKHLAVTCVITEEHDDIEFRYKLDDFDKWVRDSPYTSTMRGREPIQIITHPTRFILNGRFYGWCEGERFRGHLVNLRRRGLLFYDACIVLERPGREPTSVIDMNDGGILFVYTDAARPVSPLLIVNPETQLTYVEEDFITKDIPIPNFEVLMRGWTRTNVDGSNITGGYVEYLDPYEVGNIYGNTTVLVAESFWLLAKHRELLNTLNKAYRNISAILIQSKYVDPNNPRKLLVPNDALSRSAKIIYQQMIETKNALDDRSRRIYTHCELDPIAVLGITASLIPLPNHNQGVRNSYQCQMSKQALGIVHSRYEDRFDNLLKVLAYPARPLFESQMSRIMGSESTPAGTSVILAFLTWEGYNQEDSIILNKRSLERGKFRHVRYAVVRVSIQAESSDFHYIIKKPGKVAATHGSLFGLENLDENGIVKKGRRIKRGDILVARYRITTERAGTGVGKQVEEEAFQRLEHEENEGIVHDILFVPGKVVMVRIRSVKMPKVGDKTACFDDQTNILTFNRGWIPFAKLTYDDYIASLVDGEIVYVHPNDIFEYDVDDELMSITGNLMFENWLVTPNHRMLIKTPIGKRIVYAEDLPSKYGFERQGEWKGLIDVPDELVVITAIMAHCGCISETPNLILKKIPAHLIDELLLDSSHSKMERVDEDIVITSPILWEIFNEATINDVNPTLRSNVCLPSEFLLSLPSRQARLFLSWYWLTTSRAECHTPERALEPFARSGYRTFTFTSSSAAELFSRLIFHAGWIAQIIDHDMTNRPNARKYKNSRYSVKLMIREFGVVKTEPTRVPYKGKVYCCSVDSGIIYVSRNGVPMWSGNSRSAQKQSISRIVPHEEMPWVARDGTVPDVIINPQCILSRMTIAMLIEIISSKTAAMRFRRVNATAFRPFDLDEMFRLLRQYGFNPTGTEVLYSQQTGQPIGPAFIGPCYYQLLRHQVDDKYQMRGIGRVSKISRQPPGSRSGDGGLRGGTMEVQSTRSLGAAHFTQELLCKSSDETSVVVCTCGYVPTIFGSDTRHVRCPRCRERGKYGIVRIPYPLLLVKETLGGANIHLSLQIKK